jgi:hypothetical protein
MRWISKQDKLKKLYKSNDWCNKYKYKKAFPLFPLYVNGDNIWLETVYIKQLLCYNEVGLDNSPYYYWCTFGLVTKKEFEDSTIND